MAEYAPSGPAWVMRYPNKVLGAAKDTLWAVWSKASHDEQRSTEVGAVFFVYVRPRPGVSPADTMRLDLAEMTGSTTGAVRKHLTKLRKLGLVETSGLCATLHVPECANQPGSGQKPTLAGPKPTRIGSPIRVENQPGSGQKPTRSGSETNPDRVNHVNSPISLSPYLPRPDQPRNQHNAGPADSERIAQANPHLDPEALARHAAIGQAQGRAQPPPQPVPDLDPRLAQALATWPDRERWYLELENPRWLGWLGEAAQRLRLSPKAVLAVLREHDRERAELESEARLREAENRGTFPRREHLWWTWGPRGKAAAAWLSSTLERLEKRRAAKQAAPKRSLDPCSEEWERVEGERLRKRAEAAEAQARAATKRSPDPASEEWERELSGRRPHG